VLVIVALQYVTLREIPVKRKSLSSSKLLEARS
jgi:hypothetical protein